MIRPNLISLWIVFDIYIFIKLISIKKFKDLLMIILYSVIGVLIVFVPILIYLVFNNALLDFVQSYIIFNFKYSVIKEASIIQTLKFLIIRTERIVFYVFSLNTVLLFYYMYKKEKNKYLIMLVNLIYTILTVFLIIMPQRLYAHYIIIIIPTILLPIAFTINEIKINKMIIVILVLVMALYIAETTKGYIAFWKANSKQMIYLEQISRYIEENTEKNDNVLQIGNDTNIYLLSNRKYNGKYFYNTPICLYNEEMMNEFIKEVRDDLPKIIVDLRKIEYLNEEYKFNKEVNRILEDYYNIENNVIYVKKTSGKMSR